MHLDWVIGVLEVAKRSNWSIPRGCVCVSTRRKIVMASFRVKGELILRISEVCPGGKVFFVDIPKESEARGWMAFFNLVCGLDGDTRKRILVSPERSFLDVVKRKGLPDGGKCVVVRQDGMVSIEVQDEGVKDRLSYLEKGVVLRFVGDGKINWAEFRRWAARYWGIPSASDIYPLGDELWFLECSTPSEANRILLLNRRKFGNFDLLMDSWITIAGRSKVAWDANEVWVTVRGVPLHLRSTALARCVGEVCGEFLDSSMGCDLSSIRVKVRMSGGLPEVIPVSLGGVVFPVSVTPEVSFPLICPGPREYREAIRKGKEVVMELQPPGDPWKTEGQCGSSDPTTVEFAGETSGFGGSKDVECGRHVMETGLTDFSEHEGFGWNVDGDGDGFFGHNRLVVVERNLNGGDREESGKVSEVAQNSITFNLTAVGLKVGGLRIEVADWALDRPLWHDAKFSAGLGELRGQSFRKALFGNGPLVGLKLWNDNLNMGWAEWPAVQGKQPPFAPHLREVRSPNQLSLSFPLKGATQDSADSPCGFLEKDHHKEIGEFWLDQAVRKVAEVINLEFEGSVEKGIEEAMGVSREVSRRRLASIPLSRTERELKKLGATPDSITEGLRTRRGDRCVISIPRIDEF
ncbi:hypothetical protein LINPERPRIM_LOCUS688 [Linum perenne]